MSEILTIIQDKLEAKQHIYRVFVNQVNKDLERSGFEGIEATTPKDFLQELADVLNEAIEDNDPKLQQLFYLADVQEKNLQHGIILGFIHREWMKIRYRLGQ